MAKLSNFLQGENPLSGQKIGIFDVSKMFSLVIGVVMLTVVWKLGSGFADTVFNKIPTSVKNAGRTTTVDTSNGKTIL